MNNSFHRGLASAGRLLCALSFIAVLAVQASDTDAQQSSSPDLQNLTPDQMLQMFGQARSGNSSGQSAGTQYPTTILEPTTPPNPLLPRSRLELIMSARAGVALSQFGYDQLGVGRSVVLPQMGGVQDSYVLGPGDEIIVTLRGQENAEYRVQVDREGSVILPRLNPISAAGRSLGEFRQDLISNVHRAYVSTEGFATVGRVRQVGIIVAGEVGSPGVRTLTGLASPIDAILVSGGIKKSGSLRNVQVIHQGRTETIDLYAFLTNGVAARQVSLADGDRIVVPTLGKTVTAAGWVRRPAIYEIAPGQSAMSVRQLTQLAGGTEVSGRYRLAILRIEPSGQTQLAPVTGETELVRDGEILLTLPDANQVVDRATLAGGTPLAGSYSVKPGMRLSELLKAPGALGTSPYTVFGIISRKDPRTYLRSLIGFSPVAALSGEDDPTLLGDDVVRVFSMRESRLLSLTLTQYEKDKEFREELTRNPYAATQPGMGAPSQFNMQGLNSNGQYSPNGPYLPNNQPFANGQLPANGQSYPNSQSAPYGQSGPNNNQFAPYSQTAPYAQGSCAQSPYAQNSYGETYPTGQSPYGDSPPSPYDQGTINGQPLGQYPGYPATTQSAPAMMSPQLSAQSNAGVAQAAMAANTSNTSGQMMPGAAEELARARCSEFKANGGLPPNLEQEFPTAGSFPTNNEARSIGQVASQLDVDVTVLLSFLEDHEVTLDGAVRGPGAYVVGPGINLHDLVMVAGGTEHWADQSGIELISTTVDEAAGRSITTRKNLALNSATLASYLVKPHDELRFHEVFNSVGVGSVTLEGEVRFPGQYKIIRGENLSDLLQRAGGLTNTAYPFGTVYLRRSVAALEEESFRRTADSVQSQLLLAMTHNATNSTSTRLDPTTFGTLQTFVDLIRNQKGLGRISVTADPALLAHRKELNIQLESGDVIYVPQRPSTVSVLGAVLQPGSFPYHAGMLAADYLKKAGGPSDFADDSLTYIVLPDGSAEKLDRSWLPFGSTPIPAGSVIVVPRDIAPVLWSDILQNSAQVFSQLAIAGASLAVISGR